MRAAVCVRACVCTGELNPVDLEDVCFSGNQISLTFSVFILSYWPGHSGMLEMTRTHTSKESTFCCIALATQKALLCFQIKQVDMPTSLGLFQFVSVCVFVCV
jgi:hypothetical protein